jgi:hypothetical protein
MAEKRKAHNSLLHPEVASWRETVVVAVDIDGTATRTFPLFRAPYSLRIRSADFLQEADADGDKTVKLRDETAAADLSAALDIDALGALAGGTIVLSDSDTRIAAGNVVSLVYTVVTAGVQAPDECTVALDLERLDYS